MTSKSAAGKLVASKPLAAFLNLLRQVVDRKLRVEPVGFPSVIYVEPTLACNLGCPACPTKSFISKQISMTEESKWHLNVTLDLSAMFGIRRGFAVHKLLL